MGCNSSNSLAQLISISQELVNRPLQDHGRQSRLEFEYGCYRLVRQMFDRKLDDHVDFGSPVSNLD